MNIEQMEKALSRASADIERGERGVATALALPWDEPDLRAERNHQLSSALGCQGEISARVREVLADVRRELGGSHD